MTALLDTSVLIAGESGRHLDTSAVPERSAICVITIGELHAGVLAATDTETVVNGLDVVTQDDDFDFIERVGGPAIIRV